LSVSDERIVVPVSPLWSPTHRPGGVEVSGARR
jgi:hypothetical protein